MYPNDTSKLGNYFALVLCHMAYPNPTRPILHFFFSFEKLEYKKRKNVIKLGS